MTETFSEHETAAREGGTPPSDLPAATAFTRWGCRAEPLPAAELFAQYDRLGFLYPAKRARLAPVLDRVRAHWDAALASPDALLRVIRHGDPTQGPFACVAGWREGAGGWFAQHLVARRSPAGAAAVMLATQDWFLDWGHRAQNWFRAGNRLPERVFTPAAHAGQDSRIADDDLYELDGLTRLALASGFEVEALDDRLDAARHLLVHFGGLLGAEGMGTERDLSPADWHAATAPWRRAGLAFDRVVWRIAHRGETLGCAIDYRGPLGLNFSFLENRLVVALRDDLAPSTALAALAALARGVRDGRSADSARYGPVVLDPGLRPLLEARQHSPFRSYRRTVWTGTASMRAWRASVYERYARVLARRGLPTTEVRP